MGVIDEAANANVSACFRPHQPSELGFTFTTDGGEDEPSATKEFPIGFAIPPKPRTSGGMVGGDWRDFLQSEGNTSDIDHDKAPYGPCLCRDCKAIRNGGPIHAVREALKESHLG